MRSSFTRTVLLAFVLPFCCNTTPDCNLPAKEVSQRNYFCDLCLLFSDYSPKLEATYYSQITPGIICQSLDLTAQVRSYACSNWKRSTLMCILHCPTSVTVYDSINKFRVQSMAATMRLLQKESLAFKLLL